MKKKAVFFNISKLKLESIFKIDENKNSQRNFSEEIRIRVAKTKNENNNANTVISVRTPLSIKLKLYNFAKKNNEVKVADVFVYIIKTFFNKYEYEFNNKIPSSF
jgi:hypothetical protein